MKKLVALMLMGVAIPAYAMMHFLVSDYYEGGNHLCSYDNGAVLNVGARLCPLSIEG